MTEKKAG